MPSPGQELASIDFGSMLGGPLLAAINAQSQAALSTVNFITAVGFKKDQNGNIGDPIYVTFKYPKEISPYQPAKPASLAITVTAPGTGYTAANTRVTVTGAGNTEAAADVSPNGTITGITITKRDTVATGASVTVAITGDGTGAAATASVTAGTDATPAVYQTQQLEVPILTMLPIPNIKIEDVTIDFNAKINSVEYAKTSDSLDINANLEASGGYGPFSAKLSVSAAYKKSSESGSNVDRSYSMQVHMRATQADMPAGMERILTILETAILNNPTPAPAAPRTT